MIPGWLYSVIGALEPGRTSQTAVLDTVRRLKRIQTMAMNSPDLVIPSNEPVFEG